ncbi:MAG: hypothetical protein KKA07_10195 [Bacteroidetes bacterium]|nr:hypothetical protein [Bacteroidota bacterium]MBU1719431.1 hypothetical protein [Bacteroidota bacterium]
MTFKDALELKSQLGKDHITQDEMTMRVFVTPADHDDFTRYVTDYRTSRFTDETSKQYSLNGQFKVHGLWTDGANVLFKDLSK